MRYTRIAWMMLALTRLAHATCSCRKESCVAVIHIQSVKIKFQEISRSYTIFFQESQQYKKILETIHTEENVEEYVAINVYLNISDES